MDLRFDFNDKIDYNKLKSQNVHHTKINVQLNTTVYLPNYRIIFMGTHPMDGSNSYTLSISFQDIRKDQNAVLIKADNIFPMNDSRFKEMKLIKELFLEHTHTAIYYSANLAEITNTIVELVKILHKIDHLKAFL